MPGKVIIAAYLHMDRLVQENPTQYLDTVKMWVLSRKLVMKSSKEFKPVQVKR